MTELQARLYQWLLDRGDNPICPSYAEMGAAIGVASKGNVARILDALETKGLVKRVAGVTRSVRAVRENPLEKVSTAEITAELDRRGADYAAFDAGIVPLAREVVRVHDNLAARMPGNWDEGPLSGSISNLRRALAERMEL